MLVFVQELSLDFGVPKSFIGLVLLPIVGNAAEHMTAVGSAYRGTAHAMLSV